MPPVENLISGGVIIALIGCLISSGAALQRLKDHATQILKLEHEIDELKKKNITIVEVQKDIQRIEEKFDGKFIDLKDIMKVNFDDLKTALGVVNDRRRR